MIIKKEFYFIRHGQTDYNLLGNKVDHPDVSLNAFGREQAQKIEPLIASLNINAVCFSPFKRAKETKDIISAKLSAKEWEIPHLGECSLSVWQEMTSLEAKAISCTNEAVQKFIQQVATGVNQALNKKKTF